MTVSREILEKRLLESKKTISNQLERIKTRAAGEHEKVKKNIANSLPIWITTDVNRKERPEFIQREYVEEMTCRSVRELYLTAIFSAIQQGNLVTFQEGLEALKYLNQEHPGVNYGKFDNISSELLKAIHLNTTLYYGDPLGKEKTYLASDSYQQHMAMLLLLIEYQQGPTLKRLLDAGRKAVDHRQDAHSMKVPNETRIFAEGVSTGIEEDIKKQQELTQSSSQPVSLLPAFEKERKVLKESIQSEDISPEEQLFRAVERGDLIQTRELLKSSKPINIDVSTRDSRDGDTPLICALNLEHLEIAQLLLGEGADPWKKNNIGHSALHALMMVHQNMNESKCKIMMALLNTLLKDKNIQKEINVAALPDGRTPCTLAICYPAFEQTKVLLEELTKAGGKYGGHDPCWAMCLNANEPFLKLKHMKTFFPEEFTIQKLRQKSSCFDNKNALEAAVGEGNIELAQYIFEKDRKAWQEIINQKPSILHTIFNSSFSQNRPEMIKFFLAEGADPLVTNNLGRTIFDELAIWEQRLIRARSDILSSTEQRGLGEIEKEFNALETIKEILKPKPNLGP